MGNIENQKQKYISLYLCLAGGVGGNLNNFWKSQCQENEII